MVGGAYQVHSLETRGHFDQNSVSESAEVTIERLPYSGTSEPLLPGKKSSEQWIPDWVLQKYAKARRRAQKRQASGFNRPNVVWLHLHKFGGTWVCHAALKQGEVASLANCNWPGDGCWGEVGKLDVSSHATPHKAACSEREASSTITFSMIERPLERSDLSCANAKLGLILRSPLDAVLSTASFEAVTDQNLTQMLQHIKSTPPSFLRVHAPESEILYRQLDNYMVRVLSGQFWTPLGRLTEQHLRDAVDTLQRMDVIIPLEKLHEHVVQLEKVFRWDANLVDTSQISNMKGAHSNHEYYLGGYSETTKKEIQELNALDRKLYSIGCELADKRRRSLQDD